MPFSLSSDEEAESDGEPEKKKDEQEDEEDDEKEEEEMEKKLAELKAEEVTELKRYIYFFFLRLSFISVIFRMWFINLIFVLSSDCPWTPVILKSVISVSEQ